MVPMTPERWRKLKEICYSALEREPGARATFLAEACVADEDLRREAESMLARATTDPRILDSPIPQDPGIENAATAPASSAAPWIPSAIGRYRIVRVVGEGGMGVVYEAEQDQPRRLVALKVIRPGLADPEMLRRFDRESQALARLHHVGIAQIYEAGTAETRFGPQPYFAMEFIHGVPLRQYAESHRLSTRERLELMAKVCESVEHAHQNGIIHRDLKPGNILVDEAGQPKVLDFGVARLTDSDAQATKQTDVGQLVGTLAYMSPEQVLADPLVLDRRSDVYALGVILYELLAQRLPYELSGKLYEAVRTIREEDATRLGSINRALRGDVETIVAKALEKDRARRYESAAAMLGDMRKHLADEPITARPASAGYQLQKFARRHRMLVSAVSAVFAVLVAGVVVSTWEAVKARRAEQTAQAVNDFLQNDLLAQASASTQAGPKTKPDPDLKVRTALDRAAARIAGKFDRQPEVEAAIRVTIGETYIDLGLYPEARTQLERALDLQRRQLGVKNLTTLKTMNDLGNTAYLQGKYDEAAALFNQNIELQRRMRGPEAPGTLSTMSNLASVYYSEAKYAQAEAICDQVLEIRRRVLGPEHGDTLSSMNNLAVVYEAQGKFAQAEALYSQVLEIRQRVLGPEHPDTVSTMSNLGFDYFQQGKYAQAEALGVRAVEIEKRVLGLDHPETIRSMSHLAGVYLLESKFGQAETLQSQALEVQRRVLGPEHLETLASAVNLAYIYSAQGKYEQAETLQKGTLEVMRRVLGSDHPYTLACMCSMADVHTERQEYARAETLYTETIKSYHRVLGPEHPSTLECIAGSAIMYERQHKYDLAQTLAAQALSGRRHALGSENDDAMASAADLATIYILQGKFDESEPLAREALEFRKKGQPDDWQRHFTESLLGASLAGQKKYAEAEPLLTDGYQGMLAQKALIDVPDQYRLNQAHEWLVQMFMAQGQPEKAAEWRKK